MSWGFVINKGDWDQRVENSIIKIGERNIEMVRFLYNLAENWFPNPGRYYENDGPFVPGSDRLIESQNRPDTVIYSLMREIQSSRQEMQIYRTQPTEEIHEDFKPDER